MAETSYNRRKVLQGVGAAALALTAPAARATAPTGVGVLYEGHRADFGYNQAHAEAARALLSLPGIRLEEVEAEPGRLPAAVEELTRARGCRIVFVTAPGDGLMTLLAQADAHRDTAFLLCAAPLDDTRLPVNVGFYEGFLNEAQHISGIVAGYASPRKQIGFVASHPAPTVLRCVNAFALGARRADPNTAVRLAYTGLDADPQSVAAVARSLVASGVDVLVPQLDRPRPVLEAAEAAGILCCGVHTDQSAIAPQGFLTGAEWSWAQLYSDIVKKIIAGEPWPRVLRGGFRDGYVRNTAYGPAVGVDARAHADAARMQLANGNASVFRGPVVDNTGRTVVAKGQSLAVPDPALERMVWLAEGVVEVGD